MRHSLNRQIALMFMVLMAGTFMLCWFFNSFFLGNYYTVNKQRELLEVFEEISTYSGSGDIASEEFDISFEKICANGNLAIQILDSGGHVIRSSYYDQGILKRQFQDVIFGHDQELYTVEKKDNYILQKSTDSRLGSDYLTLCGGLADGNMVIIRTALESIRESADISNRFLAYVGAGALCISAIAIWFLSRRLTAPILKLAEITARMKNLDFEVQYASAGRHTNEIDVLGEHVNQLSRTLQKTISELKTANNEMLRDMEQREKIHEMRKEFLSNVSHELKTPIALIQGYAEGLRECINEDEQSREFYCEVIMDEADKMNRMVKKLLTLNQLEYGEDAVSMERFDIVQLAKGVLQSMEILAAEKEARFLFRDPGPVYVWADEFKAEEVLTNYLSNAIHHVKHENVIEVKIVPGEAVARISVFNAGDPIPEEELGKLWTKFYKVDKARTREYGGSGIGLSIVKAIMESFHREYGVCNYDNGVEFWFELDRA